MSTLNGKVSIITGGASGMGAAYAKRFLQAGSKVIITDIDANRGNALVAESNGALDFHVHDVADEPSWEILAAYAQKKYGRVDVLVNNAGIGGNEPIVDFSVELYLRVVAVDQLSVLLGMKHIGRLMIAQRSGSIVNISSTSGLDGQVFGAAYCSAKWAVRALSKTGALEFAKHNVRVNCLLPGFVDTPLVAAQEYAAIRQEYEQSIPTGRAGQVAEIAEACLFLASEMSSYCNGSELVVDGGLSSTAHAFSDFVFKRTRSW